MPGKLTGFILCRGFAGWWPAAKVIRSAYLVTDELLWLPGLLMTTAPCNKVREVARRRTVMYDDGGMNDETSATV